MAVSTGEYLQELLPGTLVMTVLLLAVVSGSALNTDRTTGTLDRFRSLSIWQPAVIVGNLLGEVVRALLASSLVIGLGLLMGFRPGGGVTGVLAAVAIVVVFAFSLSWVWTAIGLTVRSPQSVSMLSFLVQFPLMFASTVFVDPATLPGWLRAIVEANPVTHLVTAECGLTTCPGKSRLQDGL
ncbi:MAG: ABC transporter permease [Acidimicrobiales bacterium]